MEGIDIVLIKMFDEMVQKLKEVKYVPQLEKNHIFVGALKALGLEISGRDSVFKMLRGSMVVLKGIRRNNTYYLKVSTVTGQVATSISSDGDCTRP